MRLKSTLWSFSCLSWLAACGDSADVVRAGLEVAVPLEAGSRVETTDNSGSSVVLSEARIRVEEFELELPEGVRCGDVQGSLESPVRCVEDNDRDDEDRDVDAEIVIDGPFVIDLLARTSTPSLSDLTLPAMRYDEIEIAFDDDAVESSIFVAGTANVDARAIPFEIALDASDEIEIESDGGVEITGVEGLRVLLDANEWFASVDLAECLREEIGATSVVRLGADDDTCDDLEDVVEDAFETSAVLESYDDEDDEEAEEDDYEDDDED